MGLTLSVRNALGRYRPSLSPETPNCNGGYNCSPFPWVPLRNCCLGPRASAGVNGVQPPWSSLALPDRLPLNSRHMSQSLGQSNLTPCNKFLNIYAFLPQLCFLGPIDTAAKNLPSPGVLLHSYLLHDLSSGDPQVQNLPGGQHGPGQWCSNWAPPNNTSITWELVRNANSPPILRNTRLRPIALGKPGWMFCPLPIFAEVLRAESHMEQVEQAR